MIFSYLCKRIKMSKPITYRYNPDTDSYERIYPTLGQKIISLCLYLLIGVLLGATIFFFVFFVFDSPTEENLRKENALLKENFSIMQRRLEASLKVMDGIRQRDDNYYRVLMQMNPITDSQRFAGLDNEQRYRQLQNLPDGALLMEITKGLDLLERELYVQSRSFDEIKNAALHRRNQLQHTPSVMPVNIRSYKIASGYGYRIDPLYSTTDFHSGVDFAGKEGERIGATADGTVSRASWQSGLGYSVEIDHGYHYKTLYAHLSQISVRQGQKVKRGQKIGEMGSSGKSISTHLHYEVRFKGEPQNPVNYWFMDMSAKEYDEMSRRTANAGNVMD